MTDAGGQVALAPRWRRGLQPSEHRALLAAGDLLAGLAAVFVSLAIWTLTAGVSLGEALTTRGWWFAAAPAWAMGLAPARQRRAATSVERSVRAVGRLAAALLVGYLVAYFYAPRQALPRLLALYFVWEAALLTVGWRLSYIWLFSHGPLRRRVLIAGAGPAGVAIARMLSDTRPAEVTVVGFVDADPTLARQTWQDLPVLGRYEDLPGLVEREDVAQVILAARLAAGDQIDSLLECEQRGVPVVPMSAVYEQTLGRVPIAHLEPSWLLTSFAEAVTARDASRLAKRLADIVGGVFGTVAFLVLFAPIALAIWLETGPPLVYRQRRAGRGGRPFTLAKFRTMVQDAEADGQPRWAGTADPRVTRVGRWLRRTRLDELPNFISVLRGDMSLVGPRPERPEFVARLQHEVPLYRARSIVRPGLTGWAQVNWPYGDSIADAAVKLEYDLYYLKHRSMLFDTWILLRTVGTVMSLRGR